MKRARALAAVVALLVVAAGGCADEPGGPAGRRFVPAGPIEPGAIHLRSDDGLVYELVAADLDSLYGVAFRLRFDPAVLRFASFEASAAWPEARVALGEEATPGKLVGVIGARGPFAGLSGHENVIAHIRFEAGAKGTSELAFEPERSGVLTAAGQERRDVLFVGGTLR
jgi:hypothetical protein